jgi:putative hydrolase of the HAD superfamily
MGGEIEIQGGGRVTMTSFEGWDAVEGIVLDAVGTLIDPSPPVARAYADAALRQGVLVDEAEVKRRFGRHFRNDEVDEQRGPMVTDEAIEYRRWRRIVANVLPDVPDLDRAFAELWDHFGRPEAWRCFPDVGRGLLDLREAGFRLRIASNFDGRLRSVAAGLPDLAGFADELVISAEVGHRKPHPSFYLAACASLGLPPDRVLCVGDDPENDVLGPERAGLRGLLLDRDGRRPPGLASFPDLLALNESIVRGPLRGVTT